MGWTLDVSIPLREKCIFCVAPHTSNWDFIIGEIYIRSLGKSSHFLMKKEWFFWPLGILLHHIGGIPVTRNKKTSLTDQLAEKAKSAKEFRLAVTPEGTRSRAEKWKRGFYFIALKAHLPIQLYAIDYKDKRIVCTQEIIPSGDVEKDMRAIMEYYRPFTGKYPEKFRIENIPE